MLGHPILNCDAWRSVAYNRPVSLGLPLSGTTLCRASLASGPAVQPPRRRRPGLRPASRPSPRRRPAWRRRTCTARSPATAWPICRAWPTASANAIRWPTCKHADGTGRLDRAIGRGRQRTCARSPPTSRSTRSATGWAIASHFLADANNPLNAAEDDPTGGTLLRRLPGLPRERRAASSWCSYGFRSRLRRQPGSGRR